MSAAGDSGMSPAVRVKEEPKWIEIEIECGASEAAPGASFYAEHEVKSEPVLGPERLQPEDIAYAVQKYLNKTEAVIVKQELEVEEDPKVKLHGEAPCGGKSCEEQNQFRSCFVKLERISIDKELHACLNCHRTFVQKSSLISHMCSNTDEVSCSNIVINKKKIENCKKKKTFKCDACGKLLTRHIHLINHIRTHTGEKPHSCEICNKQFTQRTTLTRHMLIHTEEKLHTCEICKKKFLQSSSLASHKLIHTGKKLCTCEICKKQFTNRSNLTCHMLIHTGEKPYPCEICKKPFTQRASLARHRLIHTGEKPYSCKTCKKQFTESSKLTRHMLIHTGEKPYSCKTCKKQFAESSTLASHMLIHTGEKPHACEICKRQFRHRSSLGTHRLLHTKEKLL